MAVLGRVLFSSAERVDLPDLLSIDSYAAGDWRYFLQSLVGSTKPYILSGFDVINPGGSIGLPACSIRVADSVVYYPGSSAGPFFYGLPEGNQNSEPLVPQLRTNAVNYVYLTLGTFDTASDTRAFWDPDRNGGDGGEFTQDVNTESVIQAQINVSTGSFPANTVPVAIIEMGPSTILSITDARDMMFRLGTGGISPDPSNNFIFPNLPASQYARNEPATSTSSISDPNPFQGGDKNIKTLKEWMDAVMTKLKELGGSRYWYEDAETYNLVNLFNDALTTTWKSKGAYTHSSSTAGRLSWSEDIYVKSTSSPLDIVIRASGANPLDLGNEQVAFINLVRDEPINTLDIPVAFTNGQAYLNTIGGSVGLFQNLKKGDWVKKASDPDIYYRQVREFYNTTQSPGPVSGSPTSAADARSVTLSGAYLGTSSQPSGDRARFERGEYQPTDIQIVNRTDPALTNAGGDLLWFALRSDTVMAITALSTVTVTGTITSVDGEGASVTATAHGLIDGDRITVSAPAGQAGTYTVDVVDVNTFVFKTSNTSTGAFTGRYALATTGSTSVDGFQLESANHGLDSGETVTISGTTNYNGTVVVSVRSPTQFQFAKSAASGAESAGTMRLARLDVRSEEGITKVVQGETIQVGSGVIQNMMQFIGMTSLDQTAPIYVLPGNYGTFNTGASYNSSVSDNLAARLSKNTAMLMDKAQDKTIKYLTTAVEARNVTNGSNQELAFMPFSSTVVIAQPGSVGNATVTLPEVGTPLVLAANQSAYVVINRNAASTPSIVVAATSAVPVAENVFVLATRLSGTEVYIWNNNMVAAGGTIPLAPIDVPVISVDFFSPIFAPSFPLGTVTIDNVVVNAGETVIWGNLFAGSNAVYQAVGVGTNITSWTSLYKFHGSAYPVLSDTIIVRKGQGFALQVGKFNGTNWVFNDYIRAFNGADYWEESNQRSGTITNNTTANVMSLNWAGSEHLIIDYSIVRSTARETGSMFVVTDGTTAQVTTNSAYVNGNTGVTFDATIAGAVMNIRYTSTNTGSAGSIRYSVKRWSATAGGPGGVPSYSGATTTPTAAAGPTTAIQFNSGGALAGNANFLVDVTDLSINKNGLREGVLASAITITNNQPAFTNLFAMPNAYPFIVIDYSATKEGFARVGRLTVAYDGTNVACNDAYVETGATGLALQAIVSGGNIQFQYTSTNGAGAGSFKYSWRKWS